MIISLILYLHRADDLIPEENDAVQLALKRLPPQEAYDRVFRLRRAFQVVLCDFCTASETNGSQCSLSHQLLPKDQHTKPEEVRKTGPLHYPTFSEADIPSGLPVP